MQWWNWDIEKITESRQSFAYLCTFAKDKNYVYCKKWIL